MKKIMAAVLCLLMLTWSALGAADGPLPEELLIPGQQSVSMADAVGMAYGRIQELPAEHRSSANLVRLTDNTHAWVVSVYALNASQPTAWTFTFSADDGELLWREESDLGEFWETKQRWIDAKGEQKYWTGEQFRMYERLYVNNSVDSAPDGDVTINQEEACAIAMAALGLADDRAYQLACSMTGETWQVIFVQEGVAVWQVSVDAAAGQVLLINPAGQGNG